jgi:hypothetical protein
VKGHLRGDPRQRLHQEMCCPSSSSACRRDVPRSRAARASSPDARRLGVAPLRVCARAPTA